MSWEWYPCPAQLQHTRSRHSPPCSKLLGQSCKVQLQVATWHKPRWEWVSIIRGDIYKTTLRCAAPAVAPGRHMCHRCCKLRPAFELLPGGNGERNTAGKARNNTMQTKKRTHHRDYSHQSAEHPCHDAPASCRKWAQTLEMANGECSQGMLK